MALELLPAYFGIYTFVSSLAVEGVNSRINTIDAALHCRTRPNKATKRQYACYWIESASMKLLGTILTVRKVHEGTIRLLLEKGSFDVNLRPRLLCVLQLASATKEWFKSSRKMKSMPTPGQYATVYSGGTRPQWSSMTS
ncbi:hypothetical protein BDD12DRAFT_886658 [Trichophaea hybrida]|nr:hypothetical protein BDD12DRAFT_886658 [Trichophaea hybrida]